MSRCETNTSEECDQQEEKEHIKLVLKKCGYPTQEGSKDKYQRHTRSVKRTLKKHDITTAMRPHSTLRSLLVNLKDKCKPEEQSEVIYQIPCKNCSKSYIGETGRLLKTRLDEHKAEVIAWCMEVLHFACTKDLVLEFCDSSFDHAWLPLWSSGPCPQWLILQQVVILKAVVV